MTWIKLDDKAPRHPKVASLTNLAFRWWVKGLCYASEFLTNGVLPPVFWKEVPKQSRAEIIGNKLWDWDDPNFIIHDYLDHQSSKENVEAEKKRNREKVAAFRERRKADRRNPVTDDGNQLVTRLVTDPENREQRTENRYREQTTPKASVRGVGLVLNGAQFEKLQQTHAFVGPALRVPNALHAELLGKSGNRDAELRAWYATLDADLEQSGKGTGDVFAWLRPRHQAFALAQGWIDAPPIVTTKPNAEPFSIEKALAIQAQRKAERMAKGATR